MVTFILNVSQGNTTDFLHKFYNCAKHSAVIPTVSRHAESDKQHRTTVVSSFRPISSKRHPRFPGERPRKSGACAHTYAVTTRSPNRGTIEWKKTVWRRWKRPPRRLINGVHERRKFRVTERGNLCMRMDVFHRSAMARVTRSALVRRQLLKVGLARNTRLYCLGDLWDFI